MIETSLLSAFLLGLLGSSHCVGMCGGLSAAMALNTTGSFISIASRLFAFNAGRITCYAILGAAVGLLGWGVAETFQDALIYLRLVAGALLIAMGCYIAQWWMGLTLLEHAGTKLWKFIAPSAQRFLAMKKISHVFLAGGLWGFLPCGLVYSVLAWASVSGDWQFSAVAMACFGLGTVPAMVATGFGGNAFKQVLQSLHFRRGVALLLIIFGLWTVISGLMSAGIISMGHH